MRRGAEDAERAEGAEAGARRVAGRVLESLPNALYRVELESEGRPQVTAHVSGQSGLLRLLPGEAVEIELSAYDRSRARIVGRT
jgi:translation initiation factor IF-1